MRKGNLSARELKELEDSIKDKIETTVQDLKTVEERLRYAVRNGRNNDLSNGRADNEDLGFLVARKENLLKFLQRLEETLERIRKGTFGICIRCKQPIPFKRIKAEIIATRCVSCKKAGNHIPLPSFHTDSPLIHPAPSYSSRYYGCMIKEEKTFPAFGFLQ